MTKYRDNYPHNIEAPQKVYVQYSQDIDFDYSNGKYPLGEDYEGFIWENVYIPYPHTLGDLELRRHVWMRWRVGDKDNWTLPMRFTDTFLNITTTEIEEVVGTDQVRFRFQYTLESGEIVYSEYITLTNGIDGRGIASSEIRGDNLFLLYTDGTEENVGRVVGYNGVGFGSVGSDVPGNLPWVDENGDLIWISIEELLGLSLNATNPITFDSLTTTFAHDDSDGNRHIPIGGSAGSLLSTDGAGNYTWFNIADGTTGYIPWSAIDDTAGVGDTTSLYSADYISSLIGSLSAFGIKYSVPLFTDLAGIASPASGELAVVTSDPLYPNRPVYQYDGAVWNSFFDLDADHNHDTRYFTQTQLSTSGQSTVHWNNITNKPSFDWTLNGEVGSTIISGGEVLSIIGGSGVDTTVSGNTLTISATGTIYTGGGGIDVIGTVISHENTSSVGNASNSSGFVLQAMSFDTYGHVISQSSINLDTRYTLIGHSHANLTAGNGITGTTYNGATSSTWDLAYAGSGGSFGVSNSPARYDHTHTTSSSSGTISSSISTSNGFTKNLVMGGYGVVEIQGAFVNTSGIWSVTFNTLVGTISTSAHRPTRTILVNASFTASGGGEGVIPIQIDTSGQIRSRSGGVRTIAANTYLQFHTSYIR